MNYHKLIRLIAIEFKRQAITLELKHIKRLNREFDNLSKLLVNLLIDSEALNFIKARADEFRSANFFILEEDKYQIQAKDDAETVINSYLRPIVNKLNNTIKFKDIIRKAILDGFELGGIFSMLNVILAIKSKGKLRKSFDDDYEDYIDEIEIENEVKKIIGEFNINWNLKDKEVLRQLEERVNESKYLSNKEFEIIKDIIIEEFYNKGNGPREVAREIRRSTKEISRYRSELIARTEIQVAQNKAIWEQGIKIKAPYKEWLTVGDEKVRLQHSVNQGSGAIKYEDTFAGGIMEYSPDNCESVWNCRCVLLLLPDKNSATVWNGIEIVEF